MMNSGFQSCSPVLHESQIVEGTLCHQVEMERRESVQPSKFEEEWIDKLGLDFHEDEESHKAKEIEESSDDSSDDLSSISSSSDDGFRLPKRVVKRQIKARKLLQRLKKTNPSLVYARSDLSGTSLLRPNKQGLSNYFDVNAARLNKGKRANSKESWLKYEYVEENFPNPHGLKFSSCFETGNLSLVWLTSTHPDTYYIELSPDSCSKSGRALAHLSFKVKGPRCLEDSIELTGEENEPATKTITFRIINVNTDMTEFSVFGRKASHRPEEHLCQKCNQDQIKKLEARAAKKEETTGYAFLDKAMKAKKEAQEALQSSSISKSSLEALNNYHCTCKSIKTGWDLAAKGKVYDNNQEWMAIEKNIRHRSQDLKTMEFTYTFDDPYETIHFSLIEPQDPFLVSNPPSSEPTLSRPLFHSLSAFPSFYNILGLDRYHLLTNNRILVVVGGERAGDCTAGGLFLGIQKAYWEGVKAQRENKAFRSTKEALGDAGEFIRQRVKLLMLPSLNSDGAAMGNQKESLRSSDPETSWNEPYDEIKAAKRLIGRLAEYNKIVGVVRIVGRPQQKSVGLVKEVSDLNQPQDSQKAYNTAVSFLNQHCNHFDTSECQYTLVNLVIALFQNLVRPVALSTLLI